MVVTTPKSIRNSPNPSVYLAQDNSEIRYKLLMFSQEGAARAANNALTMRNHICTNYVLLPSTWQEPC